MGGPRVHRVRVVEGKDAKAASRTPGIRLDHFIGIAEYWAIPGEAQDATFGAWKKGPGSKLLSAILGIADFVIAEDLGMAGDDAIRLRDKYGLHGMSILQFGWGTEMPPHHINCVPDRVVATRGRTTMIPSEGGTQNYHQTREKRLGKS